MTAPQFATRDALVAALTEQVRDIGWDFETVGSDVLGAQVADALLASGVVRDPATLADDEALVERATRNRFRDTGAKVYPGDFAVTRYALRALAAALTEDPS